MKTLINRLKFSLFSKIAYHLVTTIAVLTLITYHGFALANTQDVVATTVPASACEPINSSDASRVHLLNSAWVFRGGNTGTVMFYCPLPINGYTANFQNNNSISRYRIYYRDTDGGILGGSGGLTTPQRARITVRLVYRLADGLYSAGNLWSSNLTPINATEDTTAFHNNNHNLLGDALYAFVVTIYRANINEAPAFSGINFPPVVIP